MESRARCTRTLLGLWILFLFSCSAGTKAITMEEFYSVPIGASVEEVRNVVGSPYRIDKKNGEREYIYIERYDVGGRVQNERTYIFVVKNGKVIGKRYKQENTPPYDINSYDLQTSQDSSDVDPSDDD